MLREQRLRDAEKPCPSPRLNRDEAAPEYARAARQVRHVLPDEPARARLRRRRASRLRASSASVSSCAGRVSPRRIAHGTQHRARGPRRAPPGPPRLPPAQAERRSGPRPRACPIDAGSLPACATGGPPRGSTPAPSAPCPRGSLPPRAPRIARARSGTTLCGEHRAQLGGRTGQRHDERRRRRLPWKPGAVPLGLGRRAKPRGASACLRFVSETVRPGKRASSASQASGWNSSGTPAASATISRVRSSVVGPRPPVMITRQASCERAGQLLAEQGRVIRDLHAAAHDEAQRGELAGEEAAWVSWMMPSVSSVPAEMMTAVFVTGARSHTLGGFLQLVHRAGEDVDGLRVPDHLALALEDHPVRDLELGRSGYCRRPCPWRASPASPWPRCCPSPSRRRRRTPRGCSR